MENRKMAPFPLWAALHHFLLVKSNVSDKGCSLGICNHDKVCLSTVTPRLGLSLPQRCTDASVGSPTSEVYTVGSPQLRRNGSRKSSCNPAANAPSRVLCFTIISCPLHQPSLLPALCQANNPMITPRKSLVPLHLNSPQTPLISCLL